MGIDELGGRPEDSTGTRTALPCLSDATRPVPRVSAEPTRASQSDVHSDRCARLVLPDHPGLSLTTLTREDDTLSAHKLPGLCPAGPPATTSDAGKREPWFRAGTPNGSAPITASRGYGFVGQRVTPRRRNRSEKRTVGCNASRCSGQEDTAEPAISSIEAASVTWTPLLFSCPAWRATEMRRGEVLGLSCSSTAVICRRVGCWR